MRSRKNIIAFTLGAIFGGLVTELIRAIVTAHKNEQEYWNNAWLMSGAPFDNVHDDENDGSAHSREQE
jgi:hypothetical protein